MVAKNEAGEDGSSVTRVGWAASQQKLGHHFVWSNLISRKLADGLELGDRQLRPLDPGYKSCQFCLWPVFAVFPHFDLLLLPCCFAQNCWNRAPPWKYFWVDRVVKQLGGKTTSFPFSGPIELTFSILKKKLASGQSRTNKEKIRKKLWVQTECVLVGHLFLRNRSIERFTCPSRFATLSFSLLRASRAFTACWRQWRWFVTFVNKLAFCCVTCNFTLVDLHWRLHGGTKRWPWCLEVPFPQGKKKTWVTDIELGNCNIGFHVALI